MAKYTEFGENADNKSEIICSCPSITKEFAFLFPENLILDVFKIFSVVIYSSKEKLFDEKSKEKYKRNPKRLIFIVDGNVYKTLKMPTKDIYQEIKEIILV